MHTLSSDQYHNQVVGKIGFINRNLRAIDPDRQTKIWEDFAVESEWGNPQHTFIELWHASKADALPDLDTLSHKSMVLQELARFKHCIMPYALSFDRIQTQYEAMKKISDLWGSSYHNTLNSIENIVNYIEGIKESATAISPKHHLIILYTEKLQQYLAQHGLPQENPEVDAMLSSALETLQLAEANLDRQYGVLLKFMQAQDNDAPFAGVALDTQKQLALSLIAYYKPKISSLTLQNALDALTQLDGISKSFFKGRDDLAEIDQTLKRFTAIALEDKHLNFKEVDSIFAAQWSLASSNDKALVATERAINLALLARQYPQSTDSVNALACTYGEDKKFYFEVRALLPLIESELRAAIQKRENTVVYNVALSNVSQHIQQQWAEDTSRLSLQEAHDFIRQQINDSLAHNIPQQLEKFSELGLGSVTFKPIDAAFEKWLSAQEQSDTSTAKVVNALYQSIYQAKNQYFYAKETIKAMKDIGPKEVEGFLTACCTALEKAAKAMSDNRTFVDTLGHLFTQIANWSICMLSCGISSQFFQPSRTPVDQISASIEGLKRQLTRTLDHLAPSLEVANPSH